MERVMDVWSKLTTFVAGMETWQWVVAGLILLYIMRKPIKRFMKRQIRKLMRLVVKVLRLYFFMG